MSTFTTLTAGATLALLTACASPGGTAGAAIAKADEHAGHHPEASAAAPAASMPAMQERMKAMREMHDKMMNAKTPAERQALMADHMKTMQDGMDVMKGMGGMGGMGAMGAGMGDGKGMPAEMAKRHQMMEGRMEMMQMMMEMMMQRLPNPPSAR